MAHIPGKQNLAADYEFCRNQTESEWMLGSSLLLSALGRLEFKSEIDLLASRVNTQFLKYVSYRPDPPAFSVDAFTLSWEDLKFYAFPPFSVIATVLSIKDRERGERGNLCLTRLANPKLVRQSVLDDERTADTSQSQSALTPITEPSKRKTFNM